MNNSEFFLADAIDVIEEVLASGGDFRIYPKGTSMLPLLVQSRDSVVLKRREDIPAKKHDIAFYRRKNGQFVLHRVMRMCSDGTYIMCGDNQTFLEKGIEATQIIAYVSEIYRKEKKIDIGGFWYSLYVFFWTKMPLRKAVIFTKRAIAKMGRICKRTFSKHID